VYINYGNYPWGTTGIHVTAKIYADISYPSPILNPTLVEFQNLLGESDQVLLSDIAAVNWASQITFTFSSPVTVDAGPIYVYFKTDEP